MPPHARMSIVQQLLMRALVARFWTKPQARPNSCAGAPELHDRFLLPPSSRMDFADVLEDMQLAGYALDPSWFAPHFEFRFPKRRRVRGAWRARQRARCAGALACDGRRRRARRHCALCGLVARAHRAQRSPASSTRAMCSRSTASPSRCNPPAASASSWPACATAPGCRPRPAPHHRHPRPAHHRPGWTAGCSGLWAAAATTSPTRAAATTAPRPSTPTRPRAAAWRASSPSATRQDASRPASPCAAWSSRSRSICARSGTTSLRPHSDLTRRRRLTLGVPLGLGVVVRISSSTEVA